MPGPSPRVDLRCGATWLQLAPEVGGSITRFLRDDGREELHWLRPAEENDIADAAPTGMSCFPLVPFSNRIGHARFSFRGRTIELEPNFAPEPHAIHGVGWQSPWDVVDQSEDTATLEYVHVPDAWPFAFRARQRFRLTPDDLEIAMTVTNEGSDDMPVGFGWHPFFVRTPDMRIHADVEQVWLSDNEGLPQELVDVPEDWGLADGLRPDEVELDNNFTGWTGPVNIEWPDRSAGLEMSVSGPFTCLVIFTPEGEPFACAEPATNVIDAFNLAADGRLDTGMLVLEPGNEATGSVRLSTEVAS